MKKIELVIIGDVIQSRKNFNTQEWTYFHKSVENINGKFKNDLKIPFEIYSGDSFGGVCKNITTAVKIVLDFQSQKKFHKFNIALIEDEVWYGLEKNNFLELEGPALWKSQETLIQLKKETYFFHAELKNKLQSLSANTILNLILSIRNDWNDKQWSVFEKYTEGLKQEEIAEQLSVTQQYISKIMRSSKFKLVSNAEKNLIQLLNGIDNDICSK